MAVKNLVRWLRSERTVPLALWVAVVVAIAALVVGERLADLGEAWIGIIGVLGGATLAFIADRVKAAQDRSHHLAMWVYERRFAAYEALIEGCIEMMAASVVGDDERQGTALVRLQQGMARVVTYGSMEARDLVVLNTEALFSVGGRSPDISPGFREVFQDLIVLTSEETGALLPASTKPRPTSP